MYRPKYPFKEWLQTQQRINPDGSLMMVSMRNRGTAAMMYRIQLGFLNYLSDFTGKPIDMFALATPREANLPVESSYGFKVTSSENQLAFELNYENNPFEFLLAGNAYEGIAVLGILSAIAVPAYDEYLLRAEISGAYIAANSSKLSLDQFEVEYGRYPNEFEIDDLKLNKKTAKYAIKVEPNTGKIKVTVFNRQTLQSKHVFTTSTSTRCKHRMAL